jgi:plasmid stabilization system protein ParE
LKPRAIQRPAARRDFISHYVYLAEHASLEVAKRFRAAVERTYSELSRMPEMGSPRQLREGRHAGIRLWPVRGFRNYWIAYYPHRDGVAIERLFHAKQDYADLAQ